MKPDGSKSGGFKLARVPAGDIEEVKDIQAEYYLRDIYGNELLLTDAITAADKEPVLKNLAFAKVNSKEGTIAVSYGNEALEADKDYMIYTGDGETLIQGIGEYAGCIVMSIKE